MKNWNTTGKIKAILLALLALPNLIFPMGAVGGEDPVMLLFPIIFGSIAIPLISKTNVLFKKEIVRPAWNDNPLTLTRPLSFFHFGSFFFLVVGASIVAGTAMRFQTLSFMGLNVISFGVGIMIGIWLTLRWAKTGVGK